MQDELERLGTKHHLDAADALQLVTVLHGNNGNAGLNSKSVLVTADNRLAQAAEAEAVRVWNCNDAIPAGM